MLKNGFISVV